MAKILKSADNVNKSIQFEVTENAQSISLNFNSEITDDVFKKMRVNLQLVSKNKGNEVLYDVTFEELSKILKVFYNQLLRVIPLTIKDNLKLDADNKLLVTITWTGIEQVTNFSYSLNTMIGNVESPLIIKKVLVEDVKDINTEFYPVLMIDGNVLEYESVLLVQNSEGIMEPRKVLMAQSLIKTLIAKDETYLLNAVTQNQVVKITGKNVNVYLLNVV